MFLPLAEREEYAKSGNYTGPNPKVRPTSCLAKFLTERITGPGCGSSLLSFDELIGILAVEEFTFAPLPVRRDEGGKPKP